MRYKIQFIRSHQFEIHAVPKALLGKAMAGTMQMAVETAANIILLQQLQDLRAFVPLLPGQIMQKNELRQIPR